MSEADSFFLSLALTLFAVGFLAACVIAWIQIKQWKLVKVKRALEARLANASDLEKEEIEAQIKDVQRQL